MTDLLELYTNNVGVKGTLYEVCFEFGLQTAAKDASPESTMVARVRMSPQHAMATKILLDRVLRQYGESFQEIFLPAELVTKLEGRTIGEETGDVDDADRIDQD